MLAVLERDIAKGGQITRSGILKNEKNLRKRRSGKQIRPNACLEELNVEERWFYLRPSRSSLLPDHSRQYRAFREFIGPSSSDGQQVTTGEIASPQKPTLWIIVEISLEYRGISHSISPQIVCFIAPCDYCFQSAAAMLPIEPCT
jgi:hypothetical protein